MTGYYEMLPNRVHTIIILTFTSTSVFANGCPTLPDLYPSLVDVIAATVVSVIP